MPRPEKLTEASRRRRLTSSREQDSITAELCTASPALPFEEEPGDHRSLLKINLHIDAGLDLTRDFSNLLVWLSQELRRMRENRANRPTPDQMARTVAEGAKHAWKLWEWSQGLQADLFHDSPVFIQGAPPLRAVIQHLADTFDRMSEIYPKKGRGKPPGTGRDEAQWVAAPLMAFTYRHAPKATDTQRREFVRGCLELLDLDCPNPSHHPAEFAKWFRPVEREAQRGHARRHARLLAKARPLR